MHVYNFLYVLYSLNMGLSLTPVSMSLIMHLLYKPQYGSVSSTYTNILFMYFLFMHYIVSSLMTISCTNTHLYMFLESSRTISSTYIFITLLINKLYPLIIYLLTSVSLSLFIIGHTHEHNWFHTLPYFLLHVLQLLQYYIYSTEILYLL